MTSRVLSSTVAVTATLGLVLVLAAATDGPTESSNRRRLLAMPLAQRLVLSQRLGVFDSTLSGPEQEALRELDAKIQEAPPEVRTRYLELAHQYLLWVRSLPKAQKERLDAAAPEARIDLVRKYLEKAPTSEPHRTDRIAAFSPALNPLSLVDQAHFVTVWFALSPQQKAQLDQAPPSERATRLERLGRQLGVKDDRPAHLKRLEEGIGQRLPARSPAAKKLDALKSQTKADLGRRLAEVRILSRANFREVAPGQLERFAAALPSWILDALDDLPPVAARLRLAILYRMIFGDQEMPVSLTPAAAPVAPPPEAAPAAASPF